MKTCFISILCLLILVGCREEKDANTRQLEQLEVKVAELTERLEKLSAPASGLTHLVFLDLRDDLAAEEQTTFINKIHELGQINSIRKFRFGKYTDVEDPRSMKQCEVVHEMGFQDEAALPAA